MVLPVFRCLLYFLYKIANDMVKIRWGNRVMMSYVENQSKTTCSSTATTATVSPCVSETVSLFLLVPHPAAAAVPAFNCFPLSIKPLLL